MNHPSSLILHSYHSSVVKSAKLLYYPPAYEYAKPTGDSVAEGQQTLCVYAGYPPIGAGIGHFGRLAPPRQGARPVGRARRNLRHRAGPLRGHHRPQRQRQEQPAQAYRPHHPAHDGADRSARPGQRPARTGRRLPPGPDRPREHLPQRLRPRPKPAADRRTVRRDRRLLRTGPLYRHAGQALLLRHVHAPRLQCGHPRAARHPDRGRDSGGGRPDLPGQVHGPHHGDEARRGDDPVHQPRPVHHRQPVQRRHLARPWARAPGWPGRASPGSIPRPPFPARRRAAQL